MIQLPKEEIASLCRKYEVKQLWVFGSAVTDEFDPERSDVDFLIEYLPDTNLGPWASKYFELKEALEALLNRRVDLVERNAIKNPYFLTNVESQQQLLYAA